MNSTTQFTKAIAAPPQFIAPTPTLLILTLARTFPCLFSKLAGYNPTEFDPDAFHSMIAPWSHGERLCALFVLNVWNPGDARMKGWHFDFIEFMSVADYDNRKALLEWMDYPLWP
jgi:hypothetical protein